MTFLDMGNIPRTITFNHEGAMSATLVDQRKLPAKLDYIETTNWSEVVEAIKSLAVRGAPAIGAAGAVAMALWLSDARDSLQGADVIASELKRVCAFIAGARPTAVNLQWAVSRVEAASLHALGRRGVLQDALEAACAEVDSILEEDVRANRAIGANGAKLLQPGSAVLTHCNAGSLATVFYGTALGVVYAAAEQGRIGRVYADETRPVGQGARLTAWELSRAGVPVTLICDNMAAHLMACGRVDAVIVGADRIARNGDVANKIGTYGLAVLAHAHDVPFYVAAPLSTIDMSVPDGSGIVIEQRSPREVLPDPIEGVDVWNPAFDVTPARYISKIITEKAIWSPGELSMRL